MLKFLGCMIKYGQQNLASDGEFYLSYEDFLSYFGRVEVVHLNAVRMVTNETRLARRYTIIII